ncbi:MAG TPA: methyltransferase domain-containing protein [Alphaproteobacteria bacterium]|nr:methyltransferase domain-containing protein [Alphaproteobacteria bacterium]
MPDGLETKVAGSRANAAALSCPLCGYRGPFKAHKRSGRPNASCAACGSRERHRLVALYLESLGVKWFVGKRVLHFSPEYFLAPYFTRAALYVTADLTSPEADILTDITRMGIADGAFDFVMCNHVLEHISDDGAAMAEFRRVLRPGGLALITVPLDLGLRHTVEDPSVVVPADRERLFGQFDHVRRYGRDVRQRFAKSGFSVTSFGLDARQRACHAIHEGTEIFLARKPSPEDKPANPRQARKARQGAVVQAGGR